MYKNNKILAIIPARGGSKGISRKNIRILAQKPLIAWSIIESNKSKFIDKTILSSDDSEIIDIARKYSCDIPFTRPSELANDNTPGIEPVLHAINQLPGYDFIVLLQPTSPLRLSEDIDNCIAFCIDNNYKISVSVSKPDKSHFYMYTLNNSNTLIPVTQVERRYNCRQDMPPVFATNGAIYVAEVDYLLHSKDFLTSETKGFVMPRERSIDIDDLFDFDIAEYLLNRRNF